MGLFTGRQRMGVAALIMAGSIFLSRFMGLIRDKVISYAHGATIESDIYFASFVIPDFLNYLLAGGYFSITLIPLLAEYFEQGETEGWDFLSSVLTWVFVAAGSLTAIAWLFAPQLAAVAAPGFAPEALARLAFFLRIILPAQVFFLLGACLSGVLYMRRQFTVPALTPLVYNGCIIGGGLLMLDHGMEGFCWGVLGGAFAGSFLLPLFAVWKGGPMQIRLFFTHKGVKRFVWLALPLMIGQSVVVLDEQFIRIFGSLTGDGSVSLLNYARRIMLVPVGVVAQAAGVASYPFLAALIAKGDSEAFADTLHTALKNMLLCMVPIAMWMITVSEPIIRLIFEQGGFTAEQTTGTAPLLQIMLAAIACWGIQQVIGRAFYAYKDTITPAVTGTVATLLALPAYWWLGQQFGAAGVALAGSLSVTLYTGILSYIWQRRFGNAALKGLLRIFFMSALVALPACAGAWLVMVQVVMHIAHPLWGAAAALAVSGGTFGVLYLLVARLIMPDAVTLLTTLFRRSSA